MRRCGDPLETSSRRGRASRGGSKASAVGKRISWGSRFLTAGRPARETGYTSGEMRKVPESPLTPPTYPSKLSVGAPPLRSPPGQGARTGGCRAASLPTLDTLRRRPLSEPLGPKVGGQASPRHRAQRLAHRDLSVMFVQAQAQDRLKINSTKMAITSVSTFCLKKTFTAEFAKRILCGIRPQSASPALPHLFLKQFLTKPPK